MIFLNLFIASNTKLMLHVPASVSFMWAQTPKRRLIFHSFLDEPHFPRLFPDRPSVAERERKLKKEEKKKNLSYTASEAIVT